MAEAAKLKSAVYRATNDDAGDAEGDPAAMIEVDEILKEHPELIAEGVKYIKARIKDKSVTVSVISLHLLDQCMQSNGFQFQVHVIKKVLQRILKFAYVGKGTPQPIQMKCNALIRQWAVTYGSDARMADFATAAKDLSRQEEKIGRTASGASSVRSPQMQSQGSPTERTRSAPRQQQQQQVVVPIVDLDQARENLGLLKQMMSAETGVIQENELLAEVAMLCKGCQVGILSQIEHVEDEERLQEFLDLNDEISNKLREYELAMTGVAPLQRPAAGGGRTLMEADTTTSDGQAYRNTAVPAPQTWGAGGPANDSSDDEELKQALAESAQMAKQSDMKELENLFADDTVPDVTKVNYDRENYGESIASAINAKQRDAREVELATLFGGSADQSLLDTPPPVKSPPRAPEMSSALAEMDLGGAPGQGAPPAASMLRATNNEANMSDPFVALSMQASSTVPSPPTASPPRGAAESVGGGMMAAGFGAGGAVAALASGAGFAGVGNGNTGGATKDQIVQWFTRLSANKEGVLFENTLVQIGLKTQYQGTKGRLQLFVGNKSAGALTDFAVDVSWIHGLSGVCSASSGVIEPRQQMQLTVTADCLKPFCGSPALTVSFASPDGPTKMDLHLPIVAGKFLEQHTVSKTDFDASWGRCIHQGSPVTVPSTDKWMKDETLRALLSNGIHLGLVEGEVAVAHGAANFKGEHQEALVYAKVAADKGSKAVKIAVASDNSDLKSALEDQLKMLLAKK